MFLCLEHVLFPHAWGSTVDEAVNNKKSVLIPTRMGINRFVYVIHNPSLLIPTRMGINQPRNNAPSQRDPYSHTHGDQPPTRSC